MNWEGKNKDRLVGIGLVCNELKLQFNKILKIFY